MFGNHRHNPSDDNAMAAHTHAEEKHVHDKVVGGMSWNKSGGQPGRQSVYQPTSAKFASRISCGHWQKVLTHENNAQMFLFTTELLCTNAEPLIMRSY